MEGRAEGAGEVPRPSAFTPLPPRLQVGRRSCQSGVLWSNPHSSTGLWSLTAPFLWTLPSPLSPPRTFLLLLLPASLSSHCSCPPASPLSAHLSYTPDSRLSSWLLIHLLWDGQELLLTGRSCLSALWAVPAIRAFRMHSCCAVAGSATTPGLLLWPSQCCWPKQAGCRDPLHFHGPLKVGS